MVKSELSDYVNYKEKRNLEKNDMLDFEAPLYEISMYGVPLKIATGQLNKTFETYKVYYVPIYVIFNKKVKMQIGLYELEKDSLSDLTDEDGDIRIEDLTPLLYSFITSKPSLLKNFNIENEKDGESPDEEVVVEDESVDEGIIEESKDKWIKTYMNDDNYRIIYTEPNGDCFFSALVKSLKTKDITTSVRELRQQLVDEIDEDIFINYQERFNELESELKSLATKILDLKRQSKELKSDLAKNRRDRKKQLEIAEKHKPIQLKHSQLLKEKKVTEELFQTVAFMKGIKSLEQLKEKMKEQTYYADDLALAIMERVLNVKFIIFSGEIFQDEDMDNVILCTLLDKKLESIGSFLPDSYVLLEHQKNHYRAIFYNDQGSFTYDELNEDLKDKLIEKCLTNKKSSLYLIPEFKSIYDEKNKDSSKSDSLTLEEDQKDEEIDLNEEIESSKHYDENIVFTLKKSSRLPGKAGNNETIPPSEESRFKILKTYGNWREMLSDDYLGEFVYDKSGKGDDLRWSSITHLMEGIKFKKNNRKFYELFSLNSGSEISKDLKEAKEAGFVKELNLTSTKKKSTKRPTNITMDDDFIDNKKKLLEEGLMAKFTYINEKEKKELEDKGETYNSMKDVLLSTQNAKLLSVKKVGKSNEYVTYHELMNVREKLKNM